MNTLKTIMEATVLVLTAGIDGIVNGYATGLLVKQPLCESAQQPKQSIIAVVTNAHVLDDKERKVHEVVMVVKAGDGEKYAIKYPKRWWYTNPQWQTTDHSEDIAIAVLSEFNEDNHGLLDMLKPKALRFGDNQLIRTDLTDSDKTSTALIDEGTKIFVVGFPQGSSDIEKVQVWPRVKTGVISQIEGLKNGKSNIFLIDAQVRPGNSGGPVTTQREFGFKGHPGTVGFDGFIETHPEVIGLQVAGLVEEDFGVVNTGIVIPMAEVQNRVKSACEWLLDEGLDIRKRTKTLEQVRKYH